MIREIIQEAKGKMKFMIQFKDSLGNESNLPILDGGELGNMGNQHKRSVSTTNLGFMLNPGILKKHGFESGKKGVLDYMNSAARDIWSDTNGNPEAFAKAFGYAISLPMTVLKK